MDVVSTLLNGNLKEEVYRDQPHKYEIKNQEHKVYKLKMNCLIRNKPEELGMGGVILIFSTMINGFCISKCEPTLLTKRSKKNIIFIYFYMCMI